MAEKTLTLLREKFPLILILFAFSVLTVYQSVTLPIGEADDETDHYQYLQFVARTGRPPLTQAERYEAGYKGGLAPLYYCFTAWPIALVGTESPPDIRRLDQRHERHIPTDGLGFNRVLHTLDEQWPWHGQVLAWHLVRFLSLPMAWLTLSTIYALVRRVWPAQKQVAIGATIFVAFLPRFVISSAVINDDNLVFALTALLLLVEVIILEGKGHRHPTIFVVLGALFGLALLTKYFSLILIPEICLTLWLSRRVSPILTVRAMFYFLLALFITAAPWFSFIIFRFNRINELGWLPGLAASLGEPQITGGLVGLLSGQPVTASAVSYPLTAWFSLLYRSFWFEYGWMQIFAPTWIYGLFTMVLLPTILGFGLVRFWISSILDFRFWINPPIQNLKSKIQNLFALRLGLFLFVVLMRYVLSATLDTGQGRHLYPALPVIALLVSLGLYRFVSSFPTLLASHSSLLTVYALFSTFTLLNPFFILNHYPPIPVTSTSPTALAITYRHPMPFADGLSLLGFDVPSQTTADETLPVTLYWHTEQESSRDYLLSLCLQDSKNRAVACWRGHFVNGRYPARAWEVGDTLIDTVFIPIPKQSARCPESYQLNLTIWPLATDSVIPVIESAVLQQTFEQPLITIQPTTLLSMNSSTIELWQTNKRLSGLTALNLNETITYLNPMPSSNRAPVFTGTTHPENLWTALPQLSTPLYLPCDSGTTQADYFIAHPAVPSGNYEVTSSPSPMLIFSPRQRLFAPLSNTLTFGKQLSPLSIQSPTDTLLPTQTTWPITIRWQAQRWLAEPLVVSLKLLDKDFAVIGERVTMLGGRYPNILWSPTEIVEETYPLTLRPNAPSGLYRLELSLLRQDKKLPDGYEYLPRYSAEGEQQSSHNLYPTTLRLLDMADGTPPPHHFTAQLGDSIALLGYDLTQQANPQPTIFLALYWQNKAKIETDYTVFTQLLGPDGQLYAQWDNPPQAGRYPTTAWADNDTVVDRYTLVLRAGAPIGTYRLLMGMYNPLNGERLSATIDGQPQPNNAIELVTLVLP